MYQFVPSNIVHEISQKKSFNLKKNTQFLADVLKKYYPTKIHECCGVCIINSVGIQETKHIMHQHAQIPLSKLFVWPKKLRLRR